MFHLDVRVDFSHESATFGRPFTVNFLPHTPDLLGRAGMWSLQSSLLLSTHPSAMCMSHTLAIFPLPFTSFISKTTMYVIFQKRVATQKFNRLQGETFG